jgi:hypothetical protein
MASIPSSHYSVEDHIYEEIAELDSDNEDTESETETEDKSFLTLISSGRRNNLRYYGCAGWDFGTEVISSLGGLEIINDVMDCLEI